MQRHGKKRKETRKRKKRHGTQTAGAEEVFEASVKDLAKEKKSKERTPPPGRTPGCTPGLAACIEGKFLTSVG
eukprot:803044-Pelagomonas_calceolata.AAC.5